MGDVTKFPTDEVSIQTCLEVAGDVAGEIEAKRAIVLLVHGDNDIHAVCSHDFSHHDWFGHLAIAAQGATINLISEMYDDDE